MRINTGTILIVDDNSVNLEVLDQLLSGQGYNVRVATEGFMVLDSVYTDPPDLILLDIRMPKIDGFEVCKKLKADEKSHDIPVIFISALQDVSDKVRGFEVGGVDYITKPFQPEEVLARVKTHLTLRNLQKSLQQEISDHEQTEASLQQANNALRQHSAKLEYLNRELKDFAYIVSHDLKAPLRGIARLAEWLVQDYAGAFDDRGKEIVDLLIDRVKRMDNLINGILQYSRVGRIEGKNEHIDLNTLVSNIIEMIAPPDTIRVVIESSLSTVVGNRTRFEQVFQNLLSNAVKYMDKPEGHISIGCREEGAYWMFWIADNGPGIETRHQERIFQIFQTLHPHDERESTGIGLTVVKKIVELYGGNIWVESTLGEGSTFWFTLPKSVTT